MKDEFTKDWPQKLAEHIKPVEVLYAAEKKNGADWPYQLADHIKAIKSGSIDSSAPLLEGLIENMKKNLTEDKVDEFERALQND